MLSEISFLQGVHVIWRQKLCVIVQISIAENTHSEVTRDVCFPGI